MNKKLQGFLFSKLTDLFISFLFFIIGLFFKSIQSNSTGFEIFSNTLRLTINRKDIELITIIISVFSFIIALYFLFNFIRKYIFTLKKKSQLNYLNDLKFSPDDFMTEYTAYKYDDKLGYEINVYSYFEDIKDVTYEDGNTYIHGNQRNKERVRKLICRNKDCKGYMDSIPTFFYNYRYSCSVCHYNFKSKFNESTMKEKMQRKIDSKIVRNR